jgi:hypothetical protein
MSLLLFGIRHHGPGCARSLLAALEALRPDVVVLEGPADAEEALTLVGHEGLKPPVALLLYPPDEPRRAVYFPLTEFSPEWQALRWASANNVPVRLMDLPQGCFFAQDAASDAELAAEADAPPEDAESPADDQPADPRWRTDPLSLLAEAAGYRDHELWWEHQIERRVQAADLFEAIREVMTTVRSESGEPRDRDLLREAWMRRTLREVSRQGFEKIAVVCGAWHVPVLDEAALKGQREGCRAKDDDARLKGLPKLKTAVTWIPWTHTRLTFRSGYGAGVHAPGWYAHLWASRDQAPLRWVATAARLLREKDLDASSASVIEAVRLADALAAMRELRAPGLAELNEAILAVLCHGEATPLQLIRQRLEVGDLLGEVPAETPTVPLARNVAALQKRLRLAPSTEIRQLDLDLRQDNDLSRSHLLHRLNLLGMGWGERQSAGSRTSTFHEVWRLQWQPEFAVALIEANVWGNTVETAAVARVVHDGEQAAELAQIAALLDASILAGLSTAVDPLLARIQSQAAVAADVRHLMDALLPLARVARYGDVRGTTAEHVQPVLIGMFERALVGLPLACASLDEDAAGRMVESISHVQQALEILSRDDLQERWQERLRGLMQGTAHPLLRGWCCRLLLEKGRLDDDDLHRAARLALSPANPPGDCAAWATGLLKGSGLLLLHQERLWQVFDRWLSELSDEAFVELLPLLRRAFADFTPPERRQMGDKVRHLGNRSGTDPVRRQPAENLNVARAELAIPILAHILGVSDDGP